MSVVSKSHLLHGVEDDDDDIDLPELPLTEGHATTKGNFEALEIHDLEEESGSAEQLSILRHFFDEGVFHPDLAAEPINVEPMELLVDVRRWHGEARNRQPPRPQSTVKQEFIFDTVKELLRCDVIEPSDATYHS
jgi:hypothetical protein